MVVVYWKSPVVSKGLRFKEVRYPIIGLSFLQLAGAVFAYSKVSNSSTVCAYWFWVQNPAWRCLLDTMRLLFLGKKIHPVQLLNTTCLLNLDFFSQFFLDFSTKTSKIFFFLWQFYQFTIKHPVWLILDTQAKITPCDYFILRVY